MFGGLPMVKAGGMVMFCVGSTRDELGEVPEYRPALITRFGSDEGSVNLLVLLDGIDDLPDGDYDRSGFMAYVKGAKHGHAPGEWLDIGTHGELEQIRRAERMAPFEAEAKLQQVREAVNAGATCIILTPAEYRMVEQHLKPLPNSSHKGLGGVPVRME
jgi:hypothetical protein